EFGPESEVLCYGSPGKDMFPTLGHVWIGADGNCRLIFGDKGIPPKESLISEAELRQAIPLIDQVPSPICCFAYDPRPVIAAVNHLHALGKPKAIAALREYLRVSSYFSMDRLGVVTILRVLFDVPE